MLRKRQTEEDVHMIRYGRMQRHNFREALESPPLFIVLIIFYYLHYNFIRMCYIMILATICTSGKSFSSLKEIKTYLGATINIKPEEVVDMFTNKYTLDMFCYYNFNHIS